jgi:hypothetical protein
MARALLFDFEVDRVELTGKVKFSDDLDAFEWPNKWSNLITAVSHIVAR